LRIITAAVLLALPGLALAQQQAVKPPVAHYWMNVDTAAGMTMPGMGSMGGFMAGMVGGLAYAAGLFALRTVRPSDVRMAAGWVTERLRRRSSRPFFSRAFRLSPEQVRLLHVARAADRDLCLCARS